jgi:hypothetical protein
MPTFDIDPEQLTVFRVDDESLFAHDFEQKDVFQDLREYYNDDEYRFEVPADDFDAVRECLEDAYFEIVIAADFEPDTDRLAVALENLGSNRSVAA